MIAWSHHVRKNPIQVRNTYEQYDKYSRAKIEYFFVLEKKVWKFFFN